VTVISSTAGITIGQWQSFAAVDRTVTPAAAVRVGSTRFAASGVAGAGDTYADPRLSAAPRAMNSLWAAPERSGDTISRLMAGNRSTRVYNLGEQWRGLGGALLRQLAATGQGYQQTRANDPASFDDPGALARLSPEMRAQHADEVASAQAAALADVGKEASTAELQLRLQSGRTVTLRLADSLGFSSAGTQVSIEASAPLSAQERDAVQGLADGLDRALAALGQPDVAELDLGGLLGYDRQVIAGLDLAVNSAMQGQFLESFELHAGGEKPSVLLRGVDGEMRLSVDARTAVATSPAARGEALQAVLKRVGAAGERGQANAALVEQMKSALVQLQTAVAGSATGSRSAGFGGLADFEASFGGQTWRTNAGGTHRQGGQVAYQLRQTTEGGGGVAGGRQTFSESLTADFKASPRGGMLDVSTGHYIATQVRDRSTVTTLLEALPGGRQRVRRETEGEQSRVVTTYEGGRAVRQRRDPPQPVAARLPG